MGKVAALAMALFMSRQTRRMGKGTSTALPVAGPGFFSCMDPCVRFQMAVLGKGPSTALIGADKGFFPGVDPVVYA